MDDKYIGKRLIFAIFALLIVSGVTYLLKFTSADYMEMVKWIIASFVGAQTLTDIFGKQIKKEGGQNG